MKVKMKINLLYISYNESHCSDRNVYIHFCYLSRMIFPYECISSCEVLMYVHTFATKIRMRKSNIIMSVNMTIMLML